MRAPATAVVALVLGGLLGVAVAGVPDLSTLRDTDAPTTTSTTVVPTTTPSPQPDLPVTTEPVTVPAPVTTTTVPSTPTTAPDQPSSSAPPTTVRPTTTTGAPSSSLTWDNAVVLVLNRGARSGEATRAADLVAATLGLLTETDDAALAPLSYVACTPGLDQWAEDVAALLGIPVVQPGVLEGIPRVEVGLGTDWQR